jgi:FemAB-related protein (PEP-CTERM system-associated)
MWKRFDPKVRNQVRKGEQSGFQISWGSFDLLDGFYEVLSRNMRDLGTPVYGKVLFREILSTFPEHAEICLLRDCGRPAAAALLLHGWGVTEVPTASALREYNPACVNMVMYWNLLERSITRGQQVFDFGRSTTEGNTFKFKKQWGAIPHPAIWQYAVKEGTVTDMRPDNPRYQRAIRLWQRLPVRLTQYIGPAIVRGIP